MTPGELIALGDALKEKRRLENYRSGLIAAAIYNVHRGKRSQKPIKPLDFFEAKKTSTPEQLKFRLTMLAQRAQRKRDGLSR